AYLMGEWRTAQGHYTRATEVLGRIGPCDAAFELPVSLGQLALAEGKEEEARCQLQAGMALAQESGGLYPVRTAQRRPAEWDVLAGRLEAACQRLEGLLPGHLEARQTATTRRVEEQTVGEIETYETWALRPVLAWAHLERGAEARAAELLEQALAAARAGGLQ